MPLLRDGGYALAGWSRRKTGRLSNPEDPKVWILHETEGCLVEGLTRIAIPVSNVAIWGILLAIAQDVFLSYCVINLSAP